ncbi:MAG: zinc ribbon domain-containing protein [Lachnospiraceae bacterium]|nr:zinc ribbon domain-containing protein [Lachnospiraceae bacterium]
MFCKECGTQLSDDAQFCPNCGKEVVSPMSAKNTASSPPKKRTAIIIGLIGVLILGVAVGVFVITKNQTNKSSDIEITVQEPTQHENISNENVLNAGTYVNELDRITIAKDVSGQYTFNMIGYDESGDFLLLSGSIDNDNGNYVGIISGDESGSFIDKKFSIMPADNSITISSDDDSLLFLCVEYQYMSEVDALEDNTNGYDADNMVSPNVTGDTLLKEGYYGYTSNDIEYMLFIYSDSTFIISVTENTVPVLYGEGEFYSSGNDTYKANIITCDDDFMRNQTIDISVINENTLFVSAQYVQLNNVVQGTYQFGGSSPDDENLKSENVTDSGFKQPLTAYDSGILSEMGELIPYVPLTADIIGKDSHVFGTLNFGTLNKVPSSDFERYVGMSGVDPDATQDLYVYLTVVDYLVYGITKDGIIVFEKQLISANPAIPKYNSIEYVDLPEEMQSISPCICRNINDTSRYYLTWELENAYYIMEVWDRGDEKRVLNIFVTTDLQYCDWFDNSELVNGE